MILQDPTLTKETERLIQEDGYNAGYATKVGFETVEEVFKNMDDEYMSARASDIEDMKNKVVNKIMVVKILMFLLWQELTRFLQ